MTQIFTNWFLRRKIDAHVRKSGGAVEHRRVVNPYHAVSIKPGQKCCERARDLDEHRFLAVEAPSLPLPKCEEPKCTCRYVHHSDRRGNQDRRVQAHNPRPRLRNDRRSEGRRFTD